MEFTREKIDLTNEKDIVTGCIVSTEYIEKMKPLLKNLTLLEEPSNRMIVSWCLEFYEIQKSAPGALIQDVFTSKQGKLQEAQAEKITTILSHLNKNYLENPNSWSTEYYVDKTSKHIESQGLIKLAESIIGSVKTGDLEQAKKLQLNYNRVDRKLLGGTDPIRDKDFVNRIMSSIKDGLIRWPFDALDKMMKTNYRGDVIAVAGPAKRGKSFILAELGMYIPMYNGLNCALFEWEMSEEVAGLRFFMNQLGETRIPTDEAIQFPIFKGDGTVEFSHKVSEGITPQQMRQFQEQIKNYGHVGEVRIYDHHRCGRKVSDVRNAILTLERYEGVKLDVVTLDYAGLMEPEVWFKGSAYEGINHIWAEIKKMAQELDVLVYVGVQFNKSGAKEDVVNPVEASGSSRIYDYVSQFISLRQSTGEKKAGFMRLNVLGRHDNYTIDDEIVVTQALALGKPIMDAKFKGEIPNYKEFVAQFEPEKPEEEEPKGGKKGRNSKPKEDSGYKNAEWEF